MRDRIDEIEAQTEKDKEWWEKRRSNIKTEFMKELEAEAGAEEGQDHEGSEKGQANSKSSVAGSEDEPVLVETDTPSAASPSGASKKKKQGGKK